MPLKAKNYNQLYVITNVLKNTNVWRTITDVQKQKHLENLASNS